MGTMNIKPNNYFTVQGWMVTELKLKGNDLMVYAIIYGFSQTDNQYYTGGLRYLCEWTNSSKQGIQNNLKHLIQNGLIEKKEEFSNGVKYAYYKAKDIQQVLNNSQQNAQNETVDAMQQSCTGNTTELHGGIQQSCIGYTTELHGGMQQSCTIQYNNNNNILYNNKNRNSSDKSDDVCEKSEKKNPSLEEIKLYILDNNLNVDAEEFFDYYDNLNWRAGKSPITNWKAKVRAWHRKAISDNQIRISQGQETETNEYDVYDQVINSFGRNDSQNNEVLSKTFEVRQQENYY